MRGDELPGGSISHCQIWNGLRVPAIDVPRLVRRLALRLVGALDTRLYDADSIPQVGSLSLGTLHAPCSSRRSAGDETAEP